jgi:hypothetical protein
MEEDAMFAGSREAGGGKWRAAISDQESNKVGDFTEELVEGKGGEKKPQEHSQEWLCHRKSCGHGVQL